MFLEISQNSQKNTNLGKKLLEEFGVGKLISSLQSFLFPFSISISISSEIFWSFQGYRNGTFVWTEAAVRRCSSKHVLFLKLSQYSQGNTCVGVSFNKVAGLIPVTLLKRDSNTGFPLNIAKCLTKSFFTKHLRCLPLCKIGLEGLLLNYFLGYIYCMSFKYMISSNRYGWLLPGYILWVVFLIKV